MPNGLGDQASRQIGIVRRFGRWLTGKREKSSKCPVDSPGIGDWREQFRSAIATLVGHHYNQASANVRRAQALGYGLGNREALERAPMAEFVSPYTHHTQHIHVNKKNGVLPWLLAAALGSGLAWLAWERMQPEQRPPQVIERDVDVEARLEYTPG